MKPSPYPKLVKQLTEAGRTRDLNIRWACFNDGSSHGLWLKVREGSNVHKDTPQRIVRREVLWNTESEEWLPLEMVVELFPLRGIL